MVVGSCPTWGTIFYNMIKCEIITDFVGTQKSLAEDFNKRVKEFIENISIEGHTFISVNTIAYGTDFNRLRTEIIYNENLTRKVLFEKSSKNFSK